MDQRFRPESLQFGFEAHVCKGTVTLSGATTTKS